MADPTADRIRAKRLAKLSGQSTASSSAGDSQSASPSPSTRGDGPETQHRSREQGSQSQQQPQQQQSTPSTRIPKETSSQETGSNPPAPRITIRPSAATQSADAGSPKPPKPASARPAETVEQFTDKLLRSTFRFSLQQDKQSDPFGPLIYLSDIREELDSENEAPIMSLQLLDQAFLYAVAHGPHKTAFEYLIPSWRRINKQYKQYKRTEEDDPKLQVIEEARRVCLSYCHFVFTTPEIFDMSSETGIQLLKEHLLMSPDDDTALDHDFLMESGKRAATEEDAEIANAYVAAVITMSQSVATMDIDASHEEHVRVLRSLVRIPPIANAIALCPCFLPPQQNPLSLEMSTILGVFFRLSPLQDSVPLNYFANCKNQSTTYIMNTQHTLRVMQNAHIEDLLDIVNHLLRVSKEARERVLDFFAASVNFNHKRRAMHAEARQISTDGFMLNITAVLDRLCEPFLDASFSKVDKIDLNYLKRNPRVQMSDETKINADQKTSDSFYAETVDGTSNFISEVFFLAVAAHHYGTGTMASRLENVEYEAQQMERHVSWMEGPGARPSPVARIIRNRIDHLLSEKCVIQGLLMDDIGQARAVHLMRYLMVWLLRVVSGKKYPQEQFDLPLSEHQPEVFRCLPEYFLDDVISTSKFIMRIMPSLYTSHQAEELVTLCTTFLQSSQYIKNPYLKAGLVTILAAGTWPFRHGSPGVLVELLNTMPFANKYLLHALMKFHIEAEHTGTANQFFDKFNIRYEIFQVIECIWANPSYRNQLSNEAQKNQLFFVKFVNLLLNDVTFVLGESFTAFKEIHDTEFELQSRGAGMEANVRREKEDFLASTKRKAKSFMALTNQTVSMLKLFTSLLADSFTMPEIVQRLADMLGYNLDTMVGPRQLNLRVENSAQYKFQPKILLSTLIDIYLNLMSKQDFIYAVARDGRSYRPENFDKAADIINKRVLKAPEDMARWTTLRDKVIAAKQEDEQAEEDLGEIPDDFMDPLLATLMEDPVILPASKISIDRSTIMSHLLSDAHDPFNRVPLNIDDVIPDTELKNKIEAFKQERRASARASINASANPGQGQRQEQTQPERMDTSED